MNIEDLTIGEARALAAMLAGIAAPAAVPAHDNTFTPHIGKLCVVRAYASGVFFGRLEKQSGRMVEIAECRRLWSWKALESISLSSVAVGGVDPSKCLFPETVPSMSVLDAIEIIPASDVCISSINACPVAEQR